MAAHHVPELPLALHGARAEFAARLSRRVEALLQLVSLLERAPGSVTHRVQLNAYLVTLAAAAAALGFEPVESAFRQTSDQLARLGPSQPFLPSDAAALRSILGRVPSLCWDTPVTSPRPRSVESPAPNAVWVPNEGRGDPDGPEDTRCQERVSLTRRRAVVVDDDPAVVWFLAGLLSSAGVEVLEAHDGRRALDLVYQAWPDFVLSDLLMPGLDGLRLCEAIQRDPAVRDVPVLLLSWKDDLLQHARELGVRANAYLTKETRGSTVLSRVREALRPRARLEKQLKTLRNVSGRLDEFSPRLLLELVGERLRDAHVDVSQARFCYELEIREGRLRTAFRTSTRGELDRGPTAIARLLGVTSGHFTVVPSATPCPRWFAGSLAEVLTPHLAAARLAMQALCGASLPSVERVEFDHAALLAELDGLPPPFVDLLRQIQDGVSPRGLCSAGAAPRLEAVLAPLARSGVVLAVYGPDGKNLLRPQRPVLPTAEVQDELARPTSNVDLVPSPGEVREAGPGPFAAEVAPEAADGFVEPGSRPTPSPAPRQTATESPVLAWSEATLSASSPDPPQVAEPTLPLWDFTGCSIKPLTPPSTGFGDCLPDSIDDFECAWELASADLCDYISPAPLSAQNRKDADQVATPSPETSNSPLALGSAPRRGPTQLLDGSHPLDQDSLSEPAIPELESSDINPWQSVVPALVASKLEVTPRASSPIAKVSSIHEPSPNEPTSFPEGVRAGGEEAPALACPEPEGAVRNLEAAQAELESVMPAAGRAQAGAAIDAQAWVPESKQAKGAEPAAEPPNEAGEEAPALVCPEPESARRNLEAAQAELESVMPAAGHAQAQGLVTKTLIAEAILSPDALPGTPGEAQSGETAADRAEVLRENHHIALPSMSPAESESDDFVGLPKPSSAPERGLAEPPGRTDSASNSDMTLAWGPRPGPEVRAASSDPLSPDWDSVPLSSLFAPLTLSGPPFPQSAMSDTAALPLRRIHFPTRRTAQLVSLDTLDAQQAPAKIREPTPSVECSEQPATRMGEGATRLSERPPGVEVPVVGRGYLGVAKSALLTVLAAVLSFGAVRWWIAPRSHTQAAPTTSAVSDRSEAPAGSLTPPGRSLALRTKAPPSEQVKIEEFSLPANVILPTDKALLEVSVGDRQAIYVDEAFVGLGPVRPVVLNPGSHDVRVRFEGAERTYAVVVPALRMARLSIASR